MFLRIHYKLTILRRRLHKKEHSIIPGTLISDAYNRISISNHPDLMTTIHVTS